MYNFDKLKNQFEQTKNNVEFREKLEKCFIYVWLFMDQSDKNVGIKECSSQLPSKPRDRRNQWKKMITLNGNEYVLDNVKEKN